MLTTITNLFPRPDDPNRGLYNYRLFNELHSLCSTTTDATTFKTICLVPEWRIWRWPAVRQWGQEGVQSCGSTDNAGGALSTAIGSVEKVPGERIAARECASHIEEKSTLASFIPHPSAFTLSSTRYLPVFTLPFLGRSINWWFYYRALRSERLSGNSTNNQQPTARNCSSAGTNVLVPWLYPDGVAVARSVRGTTDNLWLMALGSDTFHLQSPSRRKRILAACTQAKGIICVAQVLADRLAAAGVPQAKLHVIPNGVSPLTPSLSPEGRGRRASILYVGNLVPVKGPDILLQAFASLTTQQPCHTTTTLTLIGAGPMRSKLERLARTLGIGDQVRFLGRRPPEEVADWMNRADVLCLPSRSEGMPNVVLEARACGLPVVASPAGAIPELPLDKTHFLVVPACTPAHLAAGLHDMLSRDLSKRIPDPNIPTWKTMAERILAKIERGV